MTINVDGTVLPFTEYVKKNKNPISMFILE